MNAQIVKWGNSQGIRIPKHVLDSINAKENDMVELKTESGCIIITRIEQKKPHKTLEERFAGYQGPMKSEEYDWGAPTGKEVW